MNKLPLLYSQLYLCGVVTYSLAYCHVWWARGQFIIGSFNLPNPPLQVALWSATVSSICGLAVFIKISENSPRLAVRCGRVANVCLLAACVILTWLAHRTVASERFVLATLPLLFSSFVSLHFAVLTFESRRWLANTTTVLLPAIPYGLLLNLYPAFGLLTWVAVAACVLLSLRIWIIVEDRRVNLRSLFFATFLVALSLIGFVTSSNLLSLEHYPLLKKDREAMKLRK